jgi:DNA mismatch repair protein MutL
MVQVLPAEVSRRIAAGEVIERPASVVRELLDNSLDAGADRIDISWDTGGLREIRVFDTGNGMTHDDLELCWKPHATSKIRTLKDLEVTRTLGFRGEALSSIAAVSNLMISSQGHQLHVREARLLSLKPTAPWDGTIVTVQDLFSNLPARRKFLSRPQSEGTMIRAMVLEKALPVPGVRFSLTGSGGKSEILPPQSPAERVAAVFGSSITSHNLTELTGSGDGFTLQILAADPEIMRRDRRLVQIFVNGRRVREFKMMQAVEYAYQDVHHGGVFPVAAVLIEVDPELVDFNIHPAKQEVRLRNSPEIHHRIVEVVRGYLRAHTIRATQWKPGELDTPSWPATVSERDQRGSTNETRITGESGYQPYARRSYPSEPVTPPVSFDYQRQAVPDMRFLGTIFRTFNLVEYQNKLYIIDQHAAHERLLYNRLQEDRIPQNLLVPEDFEVTEDQDARLQKHVRDYELLGIVLRRLAEGRWQLAAVPAAYTRQIETIIETVLELQGLEEELDRQFLARIACTAALKAGDLLDEISGLELARKVFALPVPRCPHGRPLWVELDRGELERLIGRR